MELKTFLVLALGLVCMTEVNALQCRNGFNTTLFDMSVYSWNETYECSSASDQSCFITKVNYSPEFLEGDSVTIYYGSCVSTAYTSYLECDQFFGSNGTGLEQVANLFPDLDNQIEDFLMVLAHQLAKQINESIANFNQTEFLEELFDDLNITLSDETLENIAQVQELVEAFQNNSTNISMLLEDLFPIILNQTIENLEEMNITVSQETIDFIMNLHTALKENDTETVNQLLEDLYPMILNKTVEYLEDMNITVPQETIDFIMELHQLFSSNETMNATLDTLYPIVLNKTLDYLEMMNITVPEDVVEFLNMLPEYIDMAMSNSSMNSSMMLDLQMILNETLIALEMNNITLSNETEYFLYLVVDLVDAYVANNTDNITAIFDEIWLLIGDTYCPATNVTVAYADALYQQLIDQGLDVPVEEKQYMRCIPGYFLHRYPNKTDEINMIFESMTLYYNNLTAYFEMVFADLNMTLPEGIKDAVRLIELLEAVQRNETDLDTAWKTYLNETAQPSELSMLILTILENNEMNVTYYQQKTIELQSMQFYYQNSQNVTDVADVIFASMNQDLQNNVDVGVAVVRAFNMTTAVNISEEIQYILMNIQPVFDGYELRMNDSGAAFDQALLDLLVAYNNQYPNDQVELHIAGLRLRIELRNNNGTLRDENVYQIIGEIFNATLKVANITREEFTNMMKENYPDFAEFIDFLATFDDQEIIEVAAKFYDWILDPNSTLSDLASIINETVYLVLERRETTIREVFSGLFNPDSCKYDTCTTGSCNLPEILEEMTTTAAATTTAATTTPDPTTTTPSTTSGAETLIASSIFIVFSVFISLW